MPESRESPSDSPHQLQEHLNSQGLEMSADRLVRWKRDAPQHPRNWAAARKVFDVTLVMFLDFFITALGTVGTAASQHARFEYNVGSTVSLFGFTSMYLLGQAVGGIIFPPYSETFGRKKLYVVSTVLFAVFSLVIAAVRSIVAVFVGRFITGFLSSIPCIVVVGSIEDMFNAKTRVWLLFVWLMTANAGLVIGPIFATYVSSWIGWRWVFYITAAIAGLSSLLSLAIRESRASQLLERRVRVIRKVTGDHTLRIETPDHAPDLRTFIRLGLFRPLRLLFTEPIVLLVSIMAATAFGLIYLFTEVLSIVYDSYGFTVEQTSLAFLPIGVGFLCCVFTRLYDYRLLAKCTKLGQVLTPENKLAGFAVAAPALAVGLWWFAWTVPPEVQNVPWIVSMLGLVLVGFAINEFDCVLVGYLADSYINFASSAYASLTLLRSVFSAVFPLFAHKMYTSLGANYASSVLAGIATVACVSPIILIRQGAKIRQASNFARYSLALDIEHGVQVRAGDDGIEFSVATVHIEGLPPSEPGSTTIAAK